MDIKDKVIIVTGASQGIGLATAAYLANQGAKIVLAARSEDKLLELEKELPKSFAVKTDMSKETDIKNLIYVVMKKFGRIDILINNAGIGLYSPVENISIEDFKKMMEVNLYGVVIAMQTVIPIMRQQGGGMIINVSSAVTKNYYPGLAAYSASKYALNAISFTARQELVADNIIVSSVLPKMTATNFTDNSLGINPELVRERLRERAANTNMVIDSAETVAVKIGELISSGEAEILV